MFFCLNFRRAVSAGWSGLQGESRRLLTSAVNRIIRVRSSFHHVAIKIDFIGITVVITSRSSRQSGAKIHRIAAASTIGAAPYGTRGTRPLRLRRSWGTRPLRLRRSWGPSVFGPLQLLRLAVIFRWTLPEASPDLLVKFGEERNKSREGNWWNVGEQ